MEKTNYTFPILRETFLVITRFIDMT